MIDVNITCTTCDGINLCERCALAGDALAGAGASVSHAPRYDALRAAQAGAARHAAYVIPVEAGERGVLDALGHLFEDRRVLIVADGDIADARIPPSFSVVTARDYAQGRVPVNWLGAHPVVGPVVGPTELVPAHHVLGPTELVPAHPVVGPTELVPSEARAHATRRLRGLAAAARRSIADKAVALDMLATLDDELLWAQASGARFAVVLAHLPGLAQRSSREASAAAEEQIDAVHDAVRAAVRRSDIVAGRHDDVLVVMSEADIAGAALAADRIARALAALPVATPLWSVGVAICPDDGTTREAVLARATVTLRPIVAPVEE